MREGSLPPVELMAPAGGPDAGYAALHYGADAVYLGLRSFSARADAENFTLDQVSELVGFAHSLRPRRRVFAAVNTLILQDELRGVIELLGTLADIEVDAVIAQDLGVCRIVRRHFPELRLHASTQMAIHNRAGVEALRDLGFARATLARELTLDEVRDIAALPGIETEFFIHGALCYSYSGLCLYSSHMLGRSGNRGRCAYTCRDEFTGGRAAGSGGRFPFSMKDLALPDGIEALRRAGVNSFKIEGRKKSALYVAAVTDFYRRLIDETLPPEERRPREADIQSIFSRPWTRLHVRTAHAPDVIDRDTVGHRGTPVGKVDAIFRMRPGAFGLRFRTARAIERHDGLQIDVPGMPKPYGFPVNALRLVGERGKTSSVFEAPAGATVEVALPDAPPSIPRGAPVYCASSQEVKRRYEFRRPRPGEFRARRTVDISVGMASNELVIDAHVPARHARESPVDLRMSLPGPFDRAKDAGQVRAAIRGVFDKLGQTRLALGRFEVGNSEGRFIPVSRLNPLRRELAERMEATLRETLAARVQAAVADVAPTAREPLGEGSLMWMIKVERAGYLDVFEEQDWRAASEVVIEIARDDLPSVLANVRSTADKLLSLWGPEGRNRIRLALPVITRRWEAEALKEKVRRLREAGWNRWELGNLSGWRFLGLNAAGPSGGARSTVDIGVDWSVYVINRAAALQVLDMGASQFTLSPEDGLENMQWLLREFGGRATVIAYQDTPLFISEACTRPRRKHGCDGAERCADGMAEVQSSRGQSVLVVTRDCRTFVLSKRPFCLAGRIPQLREAGAMSLRADFMYRAYTAAQVRALWRDLRAGRPVPESHVANFDGGLL